MVQLLMSALHKFQNERLTTCDLQFFSEYILFSHCSPKVVACCTKYGSNFYVSN